MIKTTKRPKKETEWMLYQNQMISEFRKIKNIKIRIQAYERVFGKTPQEYQKISRSFITGK